jgi:hypothetical protein
VRRSAIEGDIDHAIAAVLNRVAEQILDYAWSFRTVAAEFCVPERKAGRVLTPLASLAGR